MVCVISLSAIQCCDILFGKRSSAWPCCSWLHPWSCLSAVSTGFESWEQTECTVRLFISFLNYPNKNRSLLLWILYIVVLFLLEEEHHLTGCWQNSTNLASMPTFKTSFFIVLLALRRYDLNFEISIYIQLQFKLFKFQKVHGKNFYAILRAPRAASTEALILSTSYKPGINDSEPANNPSIALMYSLASFFRG